MAIWNEKFYKGTDVYSDGSIEDVMLDIVCRDDYKEKKYELIGNNFVLAYHLSAIRENILNWYPFTKDESAIEIGAGCGAITGMLCRKLGKVVSVDLSKRRSKINYERHKDYDNLEIIIGNFNDVNLEEKYDYVVLNGVFEYAISFTDSEKPYHDFLRHISKFLKPDGKFLIAIENKLGLKYFNGAKEDHTSNYFLGLNDYKGNETVRTFSKSELEEILADEGYKYTKFYYPYPDYKFPNEIFTEESMEDNQYGRPFINIENDRYNLFDEYAVGKTLLKEKVREIFANSFLVEASKEAFESEVIYAKMNVERKAEFQIGTSIINEGDEKHVLKYAIHPKAKAHIEKICDTTTFDGKKVVYLPAKREKEGISFEFIYEQNLDSVINEYLKKKDAEPIQKIVKEFLDAYLAEFEEQLSTSEYYNDTFKQYFGEMNSDKELLCVKNANIDVIMDNVYEIDNKYVLIDGEWIYPEWIPYAFIKWRAINELYAKHVELASFVSRSDMMDQNGVSQEDEKMFLAWAVYFAESYVGSSQRAQWAKKVQDISMDEIHRDYLSQRTVTMSLYIDHGEGYTEEGKLYQDVDIEDGTFMVVFESERLKNAKNIRFDPVEGRVCVVKITNLSDGIKLMGDNSCEIVENGSLFVNLDPQFILEVVENTDTISIEGIISVLQKDELAKCTQALQEKLSHEIYVCKEDLARQKWETQELGKSFEAVTNERNLVADQRDRLLSDCEQLVKVRDELNQVREELMLQREQLTQQRDQLIQERGELTQQRDWLVQERDQIAAENEKNYYYANSTKAFVKRKILIKLGKIDA